MSFLKAPSVDHAKNKPYIKTAVCSQTFFLRNKGL